MGTFVITPRVLSGFRDYLPEDALAKENLLLKLIPIFRSFGFLPIETPHLEYADILLKQGSDEIQKQLYKFCDNGGRDVALRFDLTVPLARYVTQHRQELGLPFKRYAIGSVFRGEKAQKGRYREFTQCDFDFIGSDCIVCDAEIAQIIYMSLEALNVGEFQVCVNNRKILNGIAQMLGVEQNINDILRIIDKLDKIGKDGVYDSLEQLHLKRQVIDDLLSFICLEAEKNKGDFLDSLLAQNRTHECFAQGLKELKEFFSLLESLPLREECFKISFCIARGLGYYTGIVYETFLKSMYSLGSICSGGRYDNLTQNFSQEKMSGVGASIGIDRLLVALKQHAIQQNTKILIVCMDDNCFLYGNKVASLIRSSEKVVELYPEAVKLKKSLSYANMRGFEYVVIIGSEELQASKVTIKNLRTSQQQLLDINSIKEYFY